MNRTHYAASAGANLVALALLIGCIAVWAAVLS